MMKLYRSKPEGKAQCTNFTRTNRGTMEMRYSGEEARVEENMIPNQRQATLPRGKIKNKTTIISQFQFAEEAILWKLGCKLHAS